MEEPEKDETLKTLFPNHRIIAYKRNKNIKDTLVITKFTRNKKDKTIILTQDENREILASLFEANNT